VTPPRSGGLGARRSHLRQHVAERVFTERLGVPRVTQQMKHREIRLEIAGLSRGLLPHD
jgi:hypothetical protein